MNQCQTSFRNNSYCVPKCILNTQLTLLCVSVIVPSSAVAHATVQVRCFCHKTQNNKINIRNIIGFMALKMFIEFLKFIHAILIATKTVMLNCHRICQF